MPLYTVTRDIVNPQDSERPAAVRGEWLNSEELDQLLNKLGIFELKNAPLAGPRTLEQPSESPSSSAVTCTFHFVLPAGAKHHLSNASVRAVSHENMLVTYHLEEE